MSFPSVVHADARMMISSVRTLPLIEVGFIRLRSLLMAGRVDAARSEAAGWGDYTHSDVAVIVSIRRMCGREHDGD
jgi:hypothetical protein